MKKTLLLLVFVAALFACNGPGDENTTTGNPDTSTYVPPTDTLGMDEIDTAKKDKPKKDKKND